MGQLLIRAQTISQVATLRRRHGESESSLRINQIEFPRGPENNGNIQMENKRYIASLVFYISEIGNSLIPKY